jgi:hypothetical protein
MSIVQWSPESFYGFNSQDIDIKTPRYLAKKDWYPNLVARDISTELAVADFTAAAAYILLPSGVVWILERFWANSPSLP